MKLRRAVGALSSIVLVIAVACPKFAFAQSAKPVARLDLAQFTTPWYEMARLPNRREKQCVGDDLVLYGLRDKKNTFQVVISCLVKGANWNYWDLPGKLDPAGSGRLKLVRLFIFHTNYWVVAADPSMAWLVVGTPNHKSLAILSKTPTLAPAVMDRIKAQADAQGFNTGKLIYVTRHGTAMNPDTAQQPAASDQGGQPEPAGGPAAPY